MDVEVFVHGVPNGESFWGKDEDRNYFGNFYGQSDDAVRFLIQVRSSNGKAYCYYNYLIYQNIIGNDGRDGSYFGLSVRIDAFCKDFMCIYKILDVIFVSHILNDILTEYKGKYKYAVADFVSVSEKMGKIKEATLQLLQSSLKNVSFCTLQGFITGSANPPSYNLYEMTIPGVEAAVRKHGGIALSPYYMTNKENVLAQQYDTKLQSVRTQYEKRYQAEIVAKDKENSSLGNSLRALQSENEKLRESNSKLNTEIQQRDKVIVGLKSRIQQFSQNAQCYKTIETIKGPIIELANVLSNRTNAVKKKTANPNEKGTGDIRKKGTVSFKNLIPLLTFVLVLILLLKSLGVETNSRSSEDDNDLLSQIEQLKTENKRLMGEIQSLQHFEDKEVNTVSQVHLSVSGYDDGRPLVKGQTYTATASDYASGSSQHNWNFVGAEIIRTKGPVVWFKPTQSPVKMEYSNDKDESKTRYLRAN